MSTSRTIAFWNEWERYLAHDVIKYWQEHQTPYEIVTKKEKPGSAAKHASFNHGVIININEQTIILDNHDCPLVRVPDSNYKVIKLQYNPQLSLNCEPFTYQVYYPDIMRKYKIYEGKRSGVFWQGNCQRGRMPWLEKFQDYLNPNWQDRSAPIDYITAMSKARIALSLRGHGDFCHRDFEAFSLKTPLVRQTFINKTRRPLIPNIHYIAADTPEAMIEIFKTVSDDFLKFIADNAYKWYVENCDYPGIMNLLKEIIPCIVD